MPDPQPATDPQTFLTFGIGGQFFALTVDTVREILDEQPMATLPEAPPDVLGLIDVRGEGVMVMEVSRRLGVRPSLDHGRRIVVIERTAGTDRGEGPARPARAARPVGVIADQVQSVVEIPPEGIEPAPRAPGGAGGRDSGLLRGVARLNGQLVMVLDHRILLGEGGGDIFDFAS